MPSPTFMLRSSRLETDYHLFCSVAESKSERPLLLAMDGDDQFEVINRAVDQLMENGAIPSVHVIGVGYGGGYRSDKNRRGRDYTPTRDATEPNPTGGATAFLGFIQDELIPFLSSRYRFPVHDVSVCGHSLGSLLAACALFQPKPIFSRYLISSPSLWWDQRSILKNVHASTGFANKPRRAFFSVGEEDSDSMRGDLSLLEQDLKARPLPGLDYTFRRFQDRDHYNVMPDAISAGMQWLFQR